LAVFGYSVAGGRFAGKVIKLGGRNRRKPESHCGTLEKIAKGLNVSVDDLLK